MLEGVSIEALDAGAVHAWVERVLADELYWFPVRHHSPAVARHVRATIKARRPSVVFIEGPAEANDLVRHVVDKRTRPPVAIYSSYRDDDDVLGLAGVHSPAPDIPARFAVWYPLLAYSPEYVAMRAAAEVGARVVLMDLPHHALIGPARSEGETEDEASADGDDEIADREGGTSVHDATHGESGGEAGAAGSSAPAPNDDAILTESGFYRAIAAKAGFSSWDQAWDSLFEFGPCARSPEDFRRELATFCAAARSTTAPSRIARDGTLERERFMWRTIRETLEAERLEPAQAFVVSGGFHLLLDREDPEPPPEPPPGTVYTSVVPYSFYRVSEHSGYGAGNRAPQFYQRVWDHGASGDVDALLSQHVVAILKRARREGEHVSSADAISVAQHARMLSALRRRSAPILDDVHDAVITCCCKGDPEEEGRYLRRAMTAVDVGTKIGVVTPEVGRLPLVNDFYLQLQVHELEEVAQVERAQKVEVDRREEGGRGRSAFLHRLAFLEIPLVRQFERDGPDVDTGTIFRETWRVGWSPDIEPALIERNLYGDTLETASLASLQERMADARGHAGHTCKRLREAVDLDLPTLLQQIESACAAAIATDTRFASLSAALAELRVLERQAVYTALDGARLATLAEQAFERACFTVPEAANAPEQEHEEIVDALRVLAEALLADEDGRFDRELFVQHVQTAVEATEVPFLRGAFIGMLTELRIVTPEESAAELASYALQVPERLVEAGEFLDGMFAAGRTSVMLGAGHLVQAIDELLEAAEWEAFLVMLPRLRAAFERLHARQRHALAGRVAEEHGLAEAEELLRLDTSLGAARVFAEIDDAVDRILANWEL